MRAIEESNLGQRFWRPQLYHLTNRPLPKKDSVILPFFDPSCKILFIFSALFFAYFFASLKTTCFLNFLLYFLSSILRSTSFLFLRVQYTSPVALFFNCMSCDCFAMVFDYLNEVSTITYKRETRKLFAQLAGLMKLSLTIGSVNPYQDHRYSAGACFRSNTRTAIGSRARLRS